MSAEETDASMRYWKAAISTLPPEKRDAAWEFYLNKFSNDRSGDTLSGLIMLLEAHGVFMQSLPMDFEARLIHPMRQTVSEIKQELQQFAEEQREIRLAVKESTETIVQYSKHVAHCGSEVHMKVQMAVQEINTERIGNVISRLLEESTLGAIKTSLKSLNDVSYSLKDCHNVAEKSANLWRSIQTSGIISCSFTFAILLAFLISTGFYKFLHRHYEQRLGEEIAYIHEQYARGLPLK